MTYEGASDRASRERQLAEHRARRPHHLKTWLTWGTDRYGARRVRADRDVVAEVDEFLKNWEPTG